MFSLYLLENLRMFNNASIICHIGFVFDRCHDHRAMIDRKPCFVNCDGQPRCYSISKIQLYERDEDMIEGGGRDGWVK